MADDIKQFQDYYAKCEAYHWQNSDKDLLQHLLTGTAVIIND